MQKTLILLALGAIVVSVVVFSGSSVEAEIPRVINYQGVVTDAWGTALTDTVYITFRIYNDSLSASPIDKKWEEIHPAVPVINGMFNVYLGGVNPLNLDFTENYWLDVTVGTDHMNERVRFASVGYAFRALVADSALTAVSVPTGGGWTDAGVVVRLETSSDSVGIGTTTPEAKLDVEGDVNINSVYKIRGNTVLDASGGNTFVGVGAGENNTGDFNTFVGMNAGYNNTDGLINTFVGKDAGISNTSGDINTYLGFEAGYSCATGGGNVFIGNQAGYSETGSNRLYIANGKNAGNVLIYGNFSLGRVGIGEPSPAEKLDVVGTVKMSGFKMSTGASSGRVLTSDGSGIGTWQTPSIGIGGSGTSNYIPKFTGGTTIGNSVIYQSSSNIGIGTTSPGTKLTVRGNSGIRLQNSSGGSRVEILVNASDAGWAGTKGPNGSWNTRLSILTGYPNNGYIAVRDAADVNQAKMYVNSSGQGIVSADVKSFCMANPNQPGTEIWYACPEGPEAAAYVRGTGHLTNGKAEIILPDHFVAVASPQGITVQLTPLSAESKGLAVVEKAVERFVVRELAGGNGNYDFDYMVMAVRGGYEDYRVIRSALEAQDAEVGLGPE